jgi:hypothetical protein
MSSCGGGHSNLAWKRNARFLTSDDTTSCASDTVYGMTMPSQAVQDLYLYTSTVHQMT